MTRQEQLKCIADTCDAFAGDARKGVEDSEELGRRRNPAMGNRRRQGCACYWQDGRLPGCAGIKWRASSTAYCREVSPADSGNTSEPSSIAARRYPTLKLPCCSRRASQRGAPEFSSRFVERGWQTLDPAECSRRPCWKVYSLFVRYGRGTDEARTKDSMFYLPGMRTERMGEAWRYR